MNILELKNKIKQKMIDNSSIIFKIQDCKFIPEQYLKEISKILNKHVEYIEQEEISNLNIFECDDNSMRVCYCDYFTKKTLMNQNYLYIITKKIKHEKELSKHIIEVPELEDWQIKEYVYSMLEGIEEKELDWLIDICNKNIYRLDNEISKLTIFGENERKYVFEDMKYEGNFNDLSSFNVYDITNSITTKNIDKLNKALTEIYNFDAEPLGVVTLLYQAFKKMIQVWFSKNPTPETTGLKANVIYAINKAPKVFNKEQVLQCFIEMVNIDKKLKTGLIETKYLIDYCVCKILSM